MPQTHLWQLAKPSSSHITIPRKGAAPLKLWWPACRPMPDHLWLFIPLGARLLIPRSEWPPTAPEWQGLPAARRAHNVEYVHGGPVAPRSQRS